MGRGAVQRGVQRRGVCCIVEKVETAKYRCGGNGKCAVKEGSLDYFAAFSPKSVKRPPL